MSINKPNFFLLGSGRCGSDSVYHMLEQHPDIFASKIKEPSFFCSYFQVVKNPIDYFNLFSERKKEKLIGEGSHVYFSNPETPEVLKLLFPLNKFIVILRNPVNRAYSLYNWAKKRGVEKSKTFEEALKKEDMRFLDKNFKKNCPHYFWNFMYVRSSFYDVQIERYFKLFDRKQFYFLNLYEFSKDNISSIKKVFKFLGVDPNFVPKLKHHNETKNKKKMSIKTRIFLNKRFEKTIKKTERLIGERMFLDKL